MNTLMMPAAAARFNHVIAFDVAKVLTASLLKGATRRSLI